MSKVSSKSYTHAVVYTGAPYGDNEGGHVVSLHKSQEAAEKACLGRYHGQSVVALDETYDRGFAGKSAREYFAA